MDIMKTIYERRSVRQYTDQQIDKDILGKLLDAAIWAPNGGNLNPWRFIVVTSDAQKKLLLKFTPGIFDMPAAMVVICTESKQKRVNENKRMIHMADAAIAAENIVLAAHSMGIGSCIVVSFADIAIRTILNLPDQLSLNILVTLGYPDESPEPPPRKPITEIAFEDTYGNRWSS
jgi:nitroreductase